MPRYTNPQRNLKATKCLIQKKSLKAEAINTMWLSLLKAYGFSTLTSNFTTSKNGHRWRCL